MKENMKSVLVPFTKGFEEIELVSIVDILRRAGVRVVLASLDSHKRVLGAHHIVIEADCALPELEMSDFHAIVLAGGRQDLASNELLIAWLQAFARDSKLIGAICAAPLVLEKAGVLASDFTCYPGCEQGIVGKTRQDCALVVSENCITSAAPATALIFALALVRALCGEEAARTLETELQLPLLQAHLVR